MEPKGVLPPIKDALPAVTETLEPRYLRRRRLVYDTNYKELYNKGKKALAAIFSAINRADYTKPQTYKQAIRSTKSAQWLALIEREVHQLEEQKTWLIVPRLLPSRVLIKGRQVYKIKRNADHSIKEFKSRWIVKGFI